MCARSRLLSVGLLAGFFALHCGGGDANENGDAGGAGASAGTTNDGGRAGNGGGQGGVVAGGAPSAGSGPGGAPIGGVSTGGSPSAGSANGGASVGGAPPAAGGGGEDDDGGAGQGEASCDHRVITCRRARPLCPEGEVPSVSGSCYGPCVPIEQCHCQEAAACPDPNMFTCHLNRQRCGPFLR